LTDAECAEHEGRARRRKTARADAIRADIVLLAAAGTSNVGIAERFGVTRVTVTTCATSSRSPPLPRSPPQEEEGRLDPGGHGRPCEPMTFVAKSGLIACQ
jgi:hypothetical protein